MELSRDVPMATGFLCDRAAVIEKTIKTLYMATAKNATLTIKDIMTSYPTNVTLQNFYQIQNYSKCSNNNSNNKKVMSRKGQEIPELE
jgi:hypothetical protein